MARSKPRRPLPDMHAQGHKQSHHAPASERAWEEEPTGIMAQCIAIGDHLVAAAKRTERALRAIGVALTEGEHQFDGPGPDQQADKAEYQRIAEAMFNNLTSDLFPMSAAKTNAGWDDDADRFSEQMEPHHTEMDVDEHQSYLSDDEDQHSDVASASDMPLFADDVDEPPSAPPSLPDTEQPTLADEPEPQPEPEPELERELEPEPATQQIAEPEAKPPIETSAPAKKRTKKKKKKAAKAKTADLELEQLFEDMVNQTQPEPTDLALVKPEAECEPSVHIEGEPVHDDVYNGEPWTGSTAEVKEEYALMGVTLTEDEQQLLDADVDEYTSILRTTNLDTQVVSALRDFLEWRFHKFALGMVLERTRGPILGKLMPAPALHPQ